MMKIHHIESPKTVEEAYQLLCSNDRNKVMGGGAWSRLTNSDVDTVITLDHLQLDTVHETTKTIEIGAMTSLRTIETNKAIQGHLNGILCDAVSQIMGIQIRNLATIGGSVMGKYSFSDILPVLLVMDTSLRFYKQGDMTMLEFMQKKKMEPDILLSVVIRKEAGKGYFHKVSKTALDFSLLNLAISHTTEWMIQIGARPGTTRPAQKAMVYLNGCKTIGEREIDTAVAIAMEEISLTSNIRASKEYRQDLLQAYLKRGLKEVM